MMFDGADCSENARLMYPTLVLIESGVFTTSGHGGINGARISLAAITIAMANNSVLIFRIVFSGHGARRDYPLGNATLKSLIIIDLRFVFSSYKKD